MKQKLLYICLVIAAFAWSGKAAGQEYKHIPFTPMNQSNYNAVVVSGSNYKWDNGIQLGDYGDGFSWGTRSCIIQFDGIPDKISFKYKKVAEATVERSLNIFNLNYAVELDVTISTDGSSFEEFWHYVAENRKADEKTIEKEITNKNIRFVKFSYKGNFGATFSDINITELKYLNVSPFAIDFGEHYDEEDTEFETSLKVSHCNAGTIEIKSDNPRFIFEPNTLNSSRDIILEQSITVKYRPNTPITDNQVVPHKDITIIDAIPVYANEPLPTCTVQVAGRTIPSTLILWPTNPSYDKDLPYKYISLNRTLKQGYNTIALPFDTNVEELTKNAKDWVAQLHTVTQSEADGFSLYFQKIEDGTIKANQPYVLYLNEEVENPKWENINREITQPIETSIEPQIGYSDYRSWTMNSNFAAGFDMNGYYGIVNEAKGLKLGGERSILNAFTAYITSPVAERGNSFRVRAAYIDPDGTTTFVDGLPVDGDWEWTGDGEPAAIYGPDGTQRARLMPGVNIVRYGDGRTRKVYKN